MRTLIIRIACMSETFNDFFLENFIPDYYDEHYGTQKGKELYLKLIQSFIADGFTHVDYEGELCTIQEYVDGINKNYWIE
jgi:hypothetical protein